MTSEELKKRQKTVDVGTLLTDVGKIVKEEEARQKEARAKGEYFNVFNVLGLKDKEVRVHSAFLAELLNPHGSHELGSKPLLAFLQTIERSKRNKLAEIDLSKVMNEKELSLASVAVEKHIGAVCGKKGGRLDISISCGKLEIAIENKIYAGDQEWQLQRYHNYLKENAKSGAARLLIYLTLDGHDASSISTGKEGCKNSIQEGKDYIAISYKDEIAQWLNECLTQAKEKPQVCETIKQYQNLIKELTGTIMGEEAMQEITKKLTKSAETLAAAKAVYDNFTSALNAQAEAWLKKKFASISKHWKTWTELSPDGRWGSSSFGFYLDEKQNTGVAFAFNGKGFVDLIPCIWQGEFRVGALQNKRSRNIEIPKGDGDDVWTYAGKDGWQKWGLVIYDESNPATLDDLVKCLFAPNTGTELDKMWDAFMRLLPKIWDEKAQKFRKEMPDILN